MDARTQDAKSLMCTEERKQILKRASKEWISYTLSQRQLCDLELLLCGGFAPLSGFLNHEDYLSVLTSMRLKSGALWPIPVVLDIPEVIAHQIKTGDAIALRDSEGVMLAALHISDVWQANKSEEAKAIYGTLDEAHWGVHALKHDTHHWYCGGKVEGVDSPSHYDFRSLRHTPHELRSLFKSRGWDTIIGFQTRNPIHRAHFELTRQAAEKIGGKLLLHPVVGQSKTGDIDSYTRVRCYQALMKYYPKNSACLSVLPLAMRMGGPREALWHALIRKNYGCTHIIIGRDHAGPGDSLQGKPFYGPYEAQELVRKHEKEMGITMVDFENVVYLKEEDVYVAASKVPKGRTPLNLSGTQLRERLLTGQEIPAWFTFPEVARELQRSFPPKHERGLTLFFTGLSGSGKSTLAKGLAARLMEHGEKSVTLLDGDEVRHFLSSELGFSKEHRRINVLRNAYVAYQVSRNRGIAICSLIAPAEDTREEARELIQTCANFVLIYVSTPLQVCETRDRKGLYAKAREGIIPNFTGISDPYDAPLKPELTIDTSNIDPQSAVDTIYTFLIREGYLLEPRPN